MNWDNIKGVGDIALDGIKAEIEMHNGSVKSIELSDGKGGRLKASLDSYSLCLLVPAKPKMKDAHLLKGEFRGLPVKELFEQEYEAKQRLREITDGSDDGALTIEKVKVAATDSGDLPKADEIPF